MVCPSCGKKLPDNAVKCNKCGMVFKEVQKNTQTDEYLKKEKEKAAKKAQKMEEAPKSRKSKSLKIIIPAAAVVLAAAIAAGVIFIKGKKKQTPPAADPVTSIEYTFEEATAENAVMTLGDINIGEEEYEFFYRQSFSNIKNNSERLFREYVSQKLGDSFNNDFDYYNQYFAEFLRTNQNIYDFRKPVNDQPVNAHSENGTEISWQEFIRNDAINTMMGYRTKYDLALKAGITVTDDVKYQVRSHIEGLREMIKNSGYNNLNQYLQLLFGPSCDEEFFKNELIREYMASKYDTVTKQLKMSSYNKDDIKKIYESDRSKYDYIDLCIYTVTGADAEKTAKKIEENTKSPESFTAAIKKNAGQNADRQTLPRVPKQYVDNNYSSELGNWAFSTDRKSNDKKVFRTDSGFIVALVQAPVYTVGNCCSYREIVFSKTDEQGAILSDEKLAQAKSDAESLYNEWKSGSATEDSFAYYAISKSQGSTASGGGLVPYTLADESSESLRSWLTDTQCKKGDTAMLETDTGYIIAYYLTNYGEVWNYTIRDEKAGEETSSEYLSVKNSSYAQNLIQDKIAAAENRIITDISLSVFGVSQ